ncbi:MAG: HIT-like protein [Parcubacteria group bacterium ADurb.Bin247]|jgi:histidine triad (HIT) family protein|nr:MAG: HIT-like protein [Parcubacteria group bacterium ADurb.Bin247]HQB85056.1 histidine triad nucleotide-binding protein [Candidatus Pacearchaeota archaeon]
MCIFCEIVNKKAPASIIYEDDLSLVFKNIRPSAPIHLLIIPKKHIGSIDHINPEDELLVGHLLYVAKKVASQENLLGYKLVVNVGKEGGQEIFHLHIHLLSGWNNARDKDII